MGRIFRGGYFLERDIIMFIIFSLSLRCQSLLETTKDEKVQLDEGKLACNNSYTIKNEVNFIDHVSIDDRTVDSSLAARLSHEPNLVVVNARLQSCMTRIHLTCVVYRNSFKLLHYNHTYKRFCKSHYKTSFWMLWKIPN